ncbi:hypothetical protein GOP47_0001372 [Adiantum capillus-veneris]|uniref:Uncharacterized protein n=1 Tax=Adiantum capillus-veneris TaxID=13818 RepID=A0A9D4V888_ADICA|nr:hypothetical protein GOP47_0001372 [Adiantum capillus-veneris]
MGTRAKAPGSTTQQHTSKTRERYEPSDLNSSSENDTSPFEGPPVHTNLLDAGNSDSDVWENLRDIFQDIDAHGGGETKENLRKPIMKLRRLVEMHTKLRAKELTLEKIYMGLRIEREWYLRKLQAIEASIGPPSSQVHSAGGIHPRVSPSFSFTNAIRTILYEDNEDYTLVGSKWR